MFALRWLLLTLFPSLVFAADLGDTTKVVIGMAVPLADMRAQNGRNAVLLAIEEANRTRPQVGGKPVSFELWVQDDKPEPGIAAYLAQSFANGPALAVIGHWLTSSTMAAAPVYDKAGMAMITPNAWGSRVTQMGFRGCFQAMGNDRQGLALTANRMVRDMGLQTFFLIEDNDELGKSLVDALGQAVEAAGGKVLQRVLVSKKTSDFNEPLMLARGLKPDVVFFSGRMAQSEVLLRNLIRLGVPGKVLVSDAVVRAEYLESVGPGMDGRLFAITPGVMSERNAAFRDLERRYAERFAHPMSPFSVYAYDAANVLIAAIKSAGELRRDKVVEALHKVKIHGVNSEISFNADGSLGHPSYTLYEVKQGKWTAATLLK